MEKQFNGFEIVRNLREKELRKFFTPVDMVHKPRYKTQQTIDCYLANSMRGAYCEVISNRKRGVEYPTAEQCYGCRKFFTQKKSFENNIKTFGSIHAQYSVPTQQSKRLYVLHIFRFRDHLRRKIAILKKELNCILFLILL